MKHYNMSRKKQCTPVPCIERNRNAIIHFNSTSINSKFINTKFTKQLAALSFAFLWLSFLSASSFDFVIPIDNNHITHTLVDCDSIFSFSSDTLRINYIDKKVRNSTITFCPQDNSQRLGVLFQEFDLLPGDTLFVYDGPDTNAPLIDKASGQGIEAAFGGAIFVSFNRKTNISSCITFSLHTNGDHEGAKGWIADIKCAERIASFTPPIIPSQQLVCGAESVEIIIPAAEIIAECGPLRFDSAMVRIFETTSGLLCGETCLSFEAGMQLPNPFGVGSYEITYNAVLDPSIATSVAFEIKAPDLICKQEVIVSTNTNCNITIYPEMVIENYCFPIQNVLHYNILIKDAAGTILDHGSTLTEEYPSLPSDALITCGDARYFVEIQQVYTAKDATVVCASDKVTAICSSPLIIQDQTVPFFTEGPQTDTIYSCGFNIDNVLTSIDSPIAADACGTTIVTLESTSLLTNNITICNNQPSYLLNWLVVDACNNAARKTDTLIIKDQTVPFFTEGPRTDSIFTCEFDIVNVLSSIALPTASDDCGTTIVTLESTSLLANDRTTCNNQSIYLLNWLVIDDCNNAARKTDTLVIKDQTVPFFTEGPRTDSIFTCDFDIANVLASIVLPTASDDCDMTIVTLESTSLLANNITTCNNQSSYLLNWLVVDDCNNAARKTDTLVIKDQTVPFFTEGPRTDTIFTCDFNIDNVLASIVLPTAEDACGMTIVTLESTSILANDRTTCNNQSGYLLNWLVVDDCNNAARKTDTLLIKDQTAPFFTEGSRTDTIYTCDFNIDNVLASMTTPIAMDDCGTTIVTLESTTILANMTTCNTQPSYTLNWLVVDDCNNATRRTDTLRVLRPIVSQLINIPLDIEVDCNAPVTDVFSRTEDSPIALLSGLQVNGEFQVTDTILLDENTPICDFLLQVRDIETGTDCGATRQRIYELIDQCNPQGFAILVDTQSIQIIDTIAPTFTTCNFSALANAEQIVLPANSCLISLNFPLPEATDNCDDKPIVKEFTVQELVNREWSTRAISVFQTNFGVGTFRIGYEASDNCGAQSNRDTCFRYLMIKDTIAPIAICQINQEIALGASGMATLSATELDNNSSDNCGITQILIKRSNCLDGEMRLDTVPLLRDSIDLSEWSMEVAFECCDLFKDVLLELLVIDGSGNYNICSSIVNPIDRVQPSCMALPPVTRACNEFETTDIGRPTDIDGDNAFDLEEWLPLFPTQAFFFNQEFGDPSELCIDNTNCITPIIEQEYQLLEGNCRTLNVKRRYRAIDRSGNVTPWVEQIIDIIYQPDWVITFPADEFTNCDIDKIEVPSSPIQEGTCDDFTWTFRDFVVRFESGNIQQINRTYSIINQCLTNGDDQWLAIGREADSDDIVRSPNIITASDHPDEDHFTYVQIIHFVDNEAPFLVLGEIDNVLLGKGDAAPFGEEDQTFGSSPLECDDNRMFSVDARDCNELSTNGLNFNWQFLKNGRLLDAGNSSSFLQTVLPDTTYTVIWQVADEFGNQTDTTVLYQFIDGVAPTPRCARGIIATLDTINRMVIVHADSLDSGSYDNCNDQSELSFFLWHESLRVDTPSVLTEVQMLPQQITFTCSDEGIVSMLLFVVDATGNYNSCPVQIEIQAPINIDCEETMIGGTITNRFGAPIEDTEIDIIGTSTRITKSDEAGNFQMMLPNNSDYTIAPSNNTNPRNGVSTFDLLLINKHIIGTSIFTSPYQYIAADVNKSGTITTYDMVIIRQTILGQITQFPNNKSWRFINKNFQFQTSNPLTEVVEESYAVEALNTDNVYMDFIGVKIGDVNGDATNSYRSSTSRNFGTAFFIYTHDLKVERGKTYTIPFYAPQFENISGFQATFKFHDLILTNKIGGIVTPDNIHGWRKGLEGSLTTSWHSLLSHDNNSVLFSLTFKATTDGHLNELLSVTSDPTPAEAYSFSGHWLDCTLSFQSPDSSEILNFGSTISPSPSLHQEYTTPVLDLEGEVFKVSQNIPNPFSTTTTINFYLPEEALTTLSVFNIHGQNILQTTQHYSKGTNQLKFVSDQLPNGTYFYQVATPFGVATHKMIIAK